MSVRTCRYFCTDCGQTFDAHRVFIGDGSDDEDKTDEQDQDQEQDQVSFENACRHIDTESVIVDDPEWFRLDIDTLHLWTLNKDGVTRAVPYPNTPGVYLHQGKIRQQGPIRGLQIRAAQNVVTRYVAWLKKTKTHRSWRDLSRNKMSGEIRIALQGAAAVLGIRLGAIYSTDRIPRNQWINIRE